jgi:hypothetical protein
MRRGVAAGRKKSTGMIKVGSPYLLHVVKDPRRHKINTGV